MIVDRIARSMTAGTPSPSFTGRVMAPIHGRPRPDFTARVMAGLDAPVARTSRRAFTPALFLIPVAVALLAGVAGFRGTGVVVPEVPDAPPLARGAFVAQPARPDWEAARLKPRPGVVQASRLPVVTGMLAEPAAPALYMIAALEGPLDISMKTIEPAACTIPALDAPAPLRVTDLPSSPGGSTQKDFKELS